MSVDHVADIARAVLYEGYLLYPYRPSSLKNQQRWNFGALFPSDYAAQGGADPCFMQMQCLIRGDPETVLSTRIRFLHFVRRESGEAREAPTVRGESDESGFVEAPSLLAQGQMFVPWDEAVEREIVVPQIALAMLVNHASLTPFDVPASRDVETVRREDGRVDKEIIRTAAALQGAISISAARVAECAYRLSLRVENTTLLPIEDRGSRGLAQRGAFASTHAILSVEGGAFISLTDPPEALREAAGACDNQGVWPVLVGEAGRADTLLASPIILPDYPQIASESPGDLFDACEIDEILTLRILTMTDDEKREIAAADSRTRALLERTEALTEADLRALHGALRLPRANSVAAVSSIDAKPRSAAIAFDGTELSVGDEVRLRPKGRADIMDVVLEGMLALVEGIERDFEGRIHIAVTIVDDPGRDLGMDRYPGHRFFFSPDEIEPIASGARQ